MKEIFNDILSAAGAEVSIIPVVQGEGMMKIDAAQLPDSLPILALRNAVLFPGTVFPITIGREKSMRLIEDAERTNSFIGAVPQNDLSVEEPRKDDLYPYGTVAKIVKTLEMPDGTITAILQGFKRFEVESVFDYEPYMLGRVRYLDDIVPEDDAKIKVIADTLKEKATAIIRSSSFVPREAVGALKGIDSFEFLVNFIATTIEVENYMDKVELLQYGDLRARAMKLLSVLDTQVELQKIKQEINQKVKSEIDQQQREYFLNNQLKTIQEELGMDDVEEFAQLRARAEEKLWPAAVQQIFDKEIAKLQNEPMSERKLKAAKKQLLGQLAISSDNGETQCLSMGKGLLAYGKVSTGKENRSMVEGITAPPLIC
jgi:ATP-dependent Lon protease